MRLAFAELMWIECFLLCHTDDIQRKQSHNLLIRRVTSTSWWQKMSLIFVPPQQQKFRIHEQRCLWGHCGIQHHLLRDQGEVSLTSASGNRQTDLGPSCESCSSTRTGFSPSWMCGPEAPREHWLRQLPMYKRAFVEMQVDREGSAHSRSKKLKSSTAFKLTVKTGGDD